MKIAYLLSVFLHIVAAMAWMGGMLFMIVALIPAIRNHPQKASLIYAVGIKFRMVGWLTLITLFVTGLFNLYMRGIEFSGSLWITNLGKLAMAKISLFVLIVTISVVHDNIIGTRAIQLMQNNPESAEAERYRNLAKQMGRIIFLLGLIAVFTGIVIVRGWI